MRSRMACKISYVLLVLCCCILWTVNSFPALPAKKPSPRDEAKAMSFMMDYGYLEPKDHRLGEFRTKEDLDRGIKQLQEFAGLEVTGKLDEATVKLIKTPRCSVPDFEPGDKMKRRKRYAIHDTEWRKLHLTYRVVNTSTLALNKHQVRITIRKAFDMWSEVSPLTFKEVFAGEADIMMKFAAGFHGDAYPFDGKGDKIAHGFYPLDNTGEAGDVHFDDDEHWTLEDPKVGTNFFWTAVHEIGHALGVVHSAYWDAIMYPYYTGYKENLKLHEDDIMAIQAKYGTKKVSATPPTIDPKLKFQGPSPCKTKFDAVVQSGDGNTYFFKEPYFWTLDKYNRPLGARKIRDHWEGLHPRVQAAYTRRDGKTVFFKGRKYWIFEGTKRIEGPKLISDYGLPDELKRPDAVFIWGANRRTYFFKGNKYWRFNEKLNQTDPGYPKYISQGWGAMRYPVSAVISWNDGNTYFFHGLNYAKYEFRKWHLYKPKKTANFFFKCHLREEKEDENIVQVALKEDDDDKNGVLKTTVLAPLVALLALLATLQSY